MTKGNIRFSSRLSVFGEIFSSFYFIKLCCTIISADFRRAIYLRTLYMFLESDNHVKLLLDRTRKAFPERTHNVKLESKESIVSPSQQ